MRQLGARAVIHEWLRDRATIRALKRHIQTMTDNPKNILSAKALEEFKWELKRAQRGYGDADNVVNRALAVIESHEQRNARVAELEFEAKSFDDEFEKMRAERQEYTDYNTRLGDLFDEMKRQRGAFIHELEGILGLIQQGDLPDENQQAALREMIAKARSAKSGGGFAS